MEVYKTIYVQTICSLHVVRHVVLIHVYLLYFSLYKGLGWIYCTHICKYTYLYGLNIYIHIYIYIC